MDRHEGEPAWVAVVEALAEIRHQVDLLEHLLVAVLKEDVGMTYEQIGALTGMSRQAAANRYRKVKRHRT